jgi:uncharacterized membrane protein YhaH (DUF805 family)
MNLPDPVYVMFGVFLLFSIAIIVSAISLKWKRKHDQKHAH